MTKPPRIYSEYMVSEGELERGPFRVRRALDQSGWYLIYKPREESYQRLGKHGTLAEALDALRDAAEVIGECNVCGPLYRAGEVCQHTVMLRAAYLQEEGEGDGRITQIPPQAIDPELVTIPGPDSVAHAFRSYRMIDAEADLRGGEGPIVRPEPSSREPGRQEQTEREIEAEVDALPGGPVYVARTPPLPYEPPSLWHEALIVGVILLGLVAWWFSR